MCNATNTSCPTSGSCPELYYQCPNNSKLLAQPGYYKLPTATTPINNKVKKIEATMLKKIEEYNACVGTPEECRKAKELSKTLENSRDKLQDLKKDSSPDIITRLNDAAASLRGLIGTLDVMKSSQQYYAIAIRTQVTYTSVIMNFVYDTANSLSSYAFSLYSNLTSYFK